MLKKLCVVLSVWCLVTACSGVTPVVEVIQHPPRGAYSVGTQELEFSDRVRLREITVALWYPTFEPSTRVRYLSFEGYAKKHAALAEGIYPLVLISHGTGGHRYNQFYLGEFLASYGYIVAAVEHPHNNAFDNQDAGTVINLWNRPQDITFVLDRLLMETPISHAINAQQIGMMGHSLGGYTAFVVAGAIPNFTRIQAYCQDHPDDDLMCQQHQENEAYLTRHPLNFDQLQDRRVKAIFVMAPALGQAFGSDDLKRVTLPVAIMASGKDEILPEPVNVQQYLQALPGPPQYVEFSGAGHYVYLHECPTLIRWIYQAPCTDQETARASVHPELRRLSLSFFEHHLKTP